MGGALLLQALLFLVFISVVLSVLGGISSQLEGENEDGPSLKIESGSALIFNPQGILSEKAPEADPIQEAINEAFGGGSPGQVSVHELVRTLEAAKNDERIKALVLDLGDLIIPDIYASKAHYLADAVEDFRESGKRVVAVGDGFGQNQYLVASEADTVLMHHKGFLFMTGYGRFRTYYSSFLDKIDVTRNVFRVGTYKSALEPILRDDMSPEAKEANEAYLSVLWGSYTSRLDENRQLADGTTAQFANQIVEAVRAAGGDIAVATVESGYVDQLMTRAEQRAYLSELVGEDDEGELNAVALKKYLISVKAPKDRDDIDNVAVVTVEGAIVDGEQEPGVASGDYVSSQLREVREDDNVKAVVLRVDSPGGSVFASELIRNEVQALKDAGKPVVVSMSSLAASGGYWISAPADAIWARPTTVTGSIGIFGYVPTFEDLAERFGIFTDGVGTTPLAGIAAAPIGALPDAAKDIFQLSIENGYANFLDVVSTGRNIPVERVAEIAEGRVWVGADAKELGLVDEFGGINDAIADAAARAGLEEWDVVGMVEKKTRFELFLEGLTGEAEAMGVLPDGVHVLGFDRSRFDKTTLGAAAALLEKEARFQASFDDPNGVYARCIACGGL